MKKILMLGAAMQQIPAILKAKELGYYVITTDYLPENPGHSFADEHYNVSTTDLDGVYKLAEILKVDGIVAYASDPSAPAAAYACEKLNLPGNPYKSVDILTHKEKFRKFLSEHGFKTPVAGAYKDLFSLEKNIDRYTFPIMIKPVDSSGSKGVVKVFNKDGLKEAFEEAMQYSREKKVLAENFIQKKGYQISGDGFSVDGELVFTSYGNELYSSFGGTRDYVALGEFWPSLFSPEILARVDFEIERLISGLGMKTCAYNIEVIIDENEDIYILELAPRNGGSYIPQLIKYATGVDLVEATIKACAGDLKEKIIRKPSIGFWSNYMIMSHKKGKFKNIKFADEFKKSNLVDVYCIKETGDEVEPYRNTTHSLGTIIFKSDTLDEMIKITSNMDAYYEVEVF